MANGTTIPDGKNQVRVPKVFVDEIRLLLNDDPEANEVFDGTEFSDQVLARHLVAILQDYNTTPPILSQSVTLGMLGSDDAYMQQLRGHVYDATCGRALRYSAIRMARNEMPFQAGSVSFNQTANWRATQAFAQELLGEWERRKRELKIAINMSGGYAVANSDLMIATLESKSGIITVSGGII